MTTLSDKLVELQKLAASPERRIKPRAAAKYTGVPEWKLGQMSATWREAEQKGDPALRKGPRFLKFKNGHVKYEVRDLDEYIAQRAAASESLSPNAAAEYVSLHRRTLENHRRAWRQAEKEGKPELRKGPRFFQEGKNIRYEKRDLDEFLATRSSGGLRQTPTSSSPDR